MDNKLNSNEGKISNGVNKKYLYISLAVAGVVIIGALALSQNKSPYSASAEYISTDVAGLTATRPTETVELKNGDTYDMTANFVEKNINGTNYRMLAYNGSIPGPLIKIAQGAEVTINFKNDTGMKTLLHSHGVRMDNAFDGSQTTQEEMEPGETFAYKLKFPDAGMYWYHPHVREDFEQELGLYGNFLVVPESANYWSPVNREVPLFLDDILIENDKIVLSNQGVDRTLMGRFGNVMLVNGETNYSLPAKKGEVVRFYVTNAANTRPFNFAIGGLKLKRVGADGGAYEHEEWVDAVTLGPSERAIVEVLFDESGTFSFQNKTPDKTYTLGNIIVSDSLVGISYAQQFTQLSMHKETVQSIDPLRAQFDRVPDKQITLSINMMGGMGGEMMDPPAGGGHDAHQMSGGSMMSAGESGIEWEDTNQMMNEMSDPDNIKWKIVDEVSGLENMEIDWSFKRGQPVKIRIFNDPNSMHLMQHPIHFHGQRFLVLERNGVKETNLVWKDTVFIPSGETVDILLDTSNPGTWMAHCHIAEHLEAGMMFSFKVL